MRVAKFDLSTFRCVARKKLEELSLPALVRLLLWLAGGKSWDWYRRGKADYA